MATLAVFIALGGSSYAAVKIGSAQIKNNSIQGKDIKNNQVSSKDVKNSSLLSKDFKAGQLPAGSRGPTGSAGAAGATNVVVRVYNSPALATGGGTSSQKVDCAPGERAVGGGVVRINPGTGDVSTYDGDAMQGSGPAARGSDGIASPAGATPTAWSSAFTYTSSDGNDYARHSVVCARP